MKKKIAISKNGKDLLRIRPWGNLNNQVEIKFVFIDENFIVRHFQLNKGKDLMLYKPVDYGLATGELTYHNSSEFHPYPSLLPKPVNPLEGRSALSHEVINLNLKNLIVPIPICRITVNKEANKPYKAKKQHLNIELDQKYNTTEIYIAPEKYDLNELAERFPMIAQNLFPMITVDYLIYGAGLGSEPIMNKMFESSKPITALTSDLVNQYRIFYKTYELVKTDAFRIYSKAEYSKNNFIEFFNNLDYLDLLATTKVGFENPSIKAKGLKAAYEWDIENLRRIRYYPEYINRWKKRFQNKERYYNKLKKFRSGVFFGTPKKK